MYIGLLSLFIGIMIILIPFMILFLLVKKVLKKEGNGSDLELRVQILEEEVRMLKSQLSMIDDL